MCSDAIQRRRQNGGPQQSLADSLHTARGHYDLSHCNCLPPSSLVSCAAVVAPAPAVIPPETANRGVQDVTQVIGAVLFAKWQQNPRLQLLR